VLFSPKIAAALRLPDGEAPVATAEDFLALNRSLQAMGGGAGSGLRGSMQALVHSSMIWSEVCGILGIAHRLSSRVEPQRGPILVSGQTLEAFSDAEIASLLSGFVLLDAVAAEAGASDLRIHLNRPEAAGSVAALLASLQGRGKAQITICVPDETGREIDVTLPQPYPVTPQAKGAIKAIQGVVMVEEV
jgi:hypothetical protein